LTQIAIFIHPPVCRHSSRVYCYQQVHKTKK